MIISHRHKFIFLRVPKTASTSIQIELSKICGPEDVITPLSFENDPEGVMSGFAGPQNYKRKYWQLQLSDWFHIITKWKPPQDMRHATALQIKRFTGNKTWNSYFKFCVVRNPFDRAISLYYWQIRNKLEFPDLNTSILSMTERELSSWFRYTIQNKLAVNKICHYEFLQEDIFSSLEIIGIPPLVLPHAKANVRKDRQHYSQLLNTKARMHIEKICASEIEYFNYQWTEK